MTDTFIHELPLRTTPHDEAVLDVRLDAARNLYNACLQESLRRLTLVRESRAYQAARKMPKGKAKTTAFSACRKAQGFEEYSLHAYATDSCKCCWIGDHLDAFTIQKIATRAFSAVDNHSFGKRGRPRFKGKGQFSSIEGKSNAAGIRWRDGIVKWSGLDLIPIFDFKDKHGVEASALASRVKFVRLVHRNINSRNRWHAQLVLEGAPLQKAKNPVAANETVGLDIGPSTIATVAKNDAALLRFCDDVIHPWKEIRREQRAQDRSRRATNPGNYNADGTIQKGSQKWHRSNRYKKRQARIAEEQRKLSATRKKLHGELCNKVLSQGNIIKLENLSYKALQKNFGRSVAVRAPGMFVNMLTRKAENAGGEIIAINTRSTKLSQTCICGKVKKKPRAMLRVFQTASRQPLPASFGATRRQSCSPVENGSVAVKAVDVVAGKVSRTRTPTCESHGKIAGLAVRTPWWGGSGKRCSRQ